MTCRPKAPGQSQGCPSPLIPSCSSALWSSMPHRPEPEAPPRRNPCDSPGPADHRLCRKRLSSLRTGARTWRLASQKELQVARQLSSEVIPRSRPMSSAWRHELDAPLPPYHSPKWSRGDARLSKLKPERLPAARPCICTRYKASVCQLAGKIRG